MKKFLLAIGVALVLTACGGGNEPAPNEAPDGTPPDVEEEPVETPDGEADDTPVDEGEGETAAGDFDATAAEEIYQKSCLGCHGGNLEGAMGPALTGTGLSAGEIDEIIENGIGTMPPQKQVEAADRENLAKWIAAQ